MLLFFCIFSATAQQLTRSHAISSHSSLEARALDSLTIIGVRVQFQPDENRLTTGDGTFQNGNLSYLNSPDIRIDPLPHNREYFEQHLKFTKNYFETVSGQQIHIGYHVLENIYQLPKKMESYSPTGKNFSHKKIAKLVSDTWQTVRQQGGMATDTLNPETTAFVIFHGGVGRDIELTGTSLNKTPQDIPSLYMGKQTLGDLLNIPSFDGFAINNSSFRITNSIVLPRTLSRPGEDITGQQFVLQLSLNGLLSASIGSYLGLPDLFNTETGESGIGRFGLMDGESFFSYQGIFPPEPSAWEKFFLGWQNPFTINKSTSGNISLPASGLYQNNSIAKYNLSGNEYFLIENRHRDPNKNGVTLTIETPGGDVEKQTFTNDNQTFVNQTDGFTDLFEAGVVTDVSSFDWSLPGGMAVGPDGEDDTDDDRLLNGGILIWHIDEAVINESLRSQTVNANPQRRGVDLEEADGAQDIGRAANSNFSSQARGTAFDFWWKNNNASVITASGDTLTLYENRFGPDTHPANQSNSGAQSFFELYDFSDNKPVATFNIRPLSSGNITPVSLPHDTVPDQKTYSDQVEAYNRSYPMELSLYHSSSDSFLIVPSQQSTYAIRLSSNSTPIFDFQSATPQQPYLGRSLVLAEEPTSNTINVMSWRWDGTQWVNNWSSQAEANNGFISSLDDQTLLLDFTPQRLDLSDGSFLSPLDAPLQRSHTIDGRYAQLTDRELQILPAQDTYSIPSSTNRMYTGTIQLSTSQSGFFLITDNSLVLYDSRDSSPHYLVKNTAIGWPAMVDINNDNRLDFLYINKKTGTLEARNSNGAMLSHFPLEPPPGSSFTGTPLVASIKNSEHHRLYLPTQDSLGINIHAYNSQGKPIEGFPLYVGGISKNNNAPIHPILSNNTLYAISHKGELKAWQLASIDDVLWGSRYGNSSYNKISGSLNAQPPPTGNPGSEILVKKETYNWPNPANNYSNIRFQTSKPGYVDIKIITSSGSVVFDKRIQTTGNAPEEHRINTQNWSSGLYFAMITATVNGEKNQKMIKMVVVH
ncbi:T9SS type A sorting domain-containing protein [Fodinibius halophilus]|uniref:T9SS type A sorting domain-containing protein n=1 Tax=Fodinibius halophilus TaxID=1736908 RepID=A0A6M1TEC9_9BACT|nr:T9SS type A sorting domain-containing protein [Fodinibius halophilus]NGP88542.1 T9SS type A sorting domain-containing protein [Fodinibius halophilus]